jgi:hypothetical protein
MRMRISPAGSVTDRRRGSKEDKMKEQASKLGRRLEAIGWGAMFVWWGIVDLVGSLPRGAGAAGVGVILLALTVIRARRGLPANGFTTAIGILALVWGVLDIAGAVLVLPFELPVFAILLIVLGVLLLAPALQRETCE